MRRYVEDRIVAETAVALWCFEDAAGLAALGDDRYRVGM